MSKSSSSYQTDQNSSCPRHWCCCCRHCRVVLMFSNLWSHLGYFVHLCWVLLRAYSISDYCPMCVTSRWYSAVVCVTSVGLDLCTRSASLLRQYRVTGPIPYPKKYQYLCYYWKLVLQYEARLNSLLIPPESHVVALFFSASICPLTLPYRRCFTLYN